ncbi:rhodanese-like domain-containing protein [Thalassotalea sp. PS06]|uniref:rhodanese-like domain-containing protein n=1 Tax=Thalassotalea sp. PS06 TaxID=2594005 RepID=UPI001164CFF8|nr:rhodanese-like domain-containing protein [Thalassotalea sp. PS06]QDP00736.1 sulfurtransferase [Thalassotalea sp. PS06]
MEHSPKFLALVKGVQDQVCEMTLEQLAQLQGPYEFIDVREDHEYQQGCLQGAKHLGRGIIERDIEKLYPDFDTKIVLYCGGGYRSILAAHNLQIMGYTRVYSLIGGYKAGVDAGWQQD